MSTDEDVRCSGIYQIRLGKLNRIPFKLLFQIK